MGAEGSELSKEVADLTGDGAKVLYERLAGCSVTDEAIEILKRAQNNGVSTFQVDSGDKVYSIVDLLEQLDFFKEGKVSDKKQLSRPIRHLFAKPADSVDQHIDAGEPPMTTRPNYLSASNFPRQVSPPLNLRHLGAPTTYSGEVIDAQDHYYYDEGGANQIESAKDINLAVEEFLQLVENSDGNIQKIIDLLIILDGRWGETFRTKKEVFVGGVKLHQWLENYFGDQNFDPKIEAEKLALFYHAWGKMAKAGYFDQNALSSLTASITKVTTGRTSSEKSLIGAFGQVLPSWMSSEVQELVKHNIGLAGLQKGLPWRVDGKNPLNSELGLANKDQGDVLFVVTEDEVYFLEIVEAFAGLLKCKVVKPSVRNLGQRFDLPREIKSAETKLQPLNPHLSQPRPILYVV